MHTIFVSSTFRDTQAERDVLRDLVAPTVNAEARKHNDAIDFCDLRWGISTQDLEGDDATNKVLDVCFREIDRCATPFVALLGYRYGTIPDPSLVARVRDINQLQLDDLEKSITALEIEYGSIMRKRPTIVYLRTITGYCPKEYLPEDNESLCRLNRLKERILALPNVHLRTYTLYIENGIAEAESLAQFANMVSDDLVKHLTPIWKVFDAKTKEQRICDQQWSFIDEKRAFFSAREEDVRACMRILESSKGCVLCKGAVGSGKTTLYAQLAQCMREAGKSVLPIACGLTSTCTTAFGVLSTLVSEMELLAGTTSPDVSPGATNSIGTLQSRLVSLAATMDGKGKRVTIMLDALDQLARDEHWESRIFFPKGLEEHANLFATCTTETSLPVQVSYVLQPLTNNDKRRVIDSVLAGIGKELSHEVREEMLSVSTSDNPLFLSLLVQRLRLMWAGDFLAKRDAERGAAVITRRQLQIVRTCPPDLALLSRKLFEEASERTAPSIGMQVLTLIAVSRMGMRAADLAKILGTSWSQLELSRLLSYLAEDLLVREDGRIDFAHKCSREGFAIERSSADIHETISAQLWELDDADPLMQKEYVYHAAAARNIGQLRAYATRYASTTDGSLRVAAASSLMEQSVEAQDGMMVDCLEDLLASQNDEPNLYVIVFFASDFLHFVPSAPTKTELDRLLPLCKIIDKCLQRERMHFDPPDYYRLRLQSANVLERLYIRTGNRRQAVSIARQGLDIAKVVYSPDNDLERAKLFGYYYNTLVALKGSDDAAILTQALSIAKEGLEYAPYDDGKQIEGMVGEYFGCMGEMCLRLDDYDGMYEMYSRDYELRWKRFSRHDTVRNRQQLSGGAGNVAYAVIRLGDTSKADHAYSLIAESLNLVDDVDGWSSAPGDMLYLLGDMAAYAYTLDQMAGADLRRMPQILSWFHQGLELVRKECLRSNLESDLHDFVMQAERFANCVSYRSKAERKRWQPLSDRWLAECESELLRQQSAASCTVASNLPIAVGSALARSTYGGHYSDMVRYLHRFFSMLTRLEKSIGPSKEISDGLVRAYELVAQHSSVLGEEDGKAYGDFMHTVEAYNDNKTNPSVLLLRAAEKYQLAKEAERRIPCASGFMEVTRRWQSCVNAYCSIGDPQTHETIRHIIDASVSAFMATYAVTDSWDESQPYLATAQKAAQSYLELGRNPSFEDTSTWNRLQAIVGKDAANGPLAAFVETYPTVNGVDNCYEVHIQSKGMHNPAPLTIVLGSGEECYCLFSTDRRATLYAQFVHADKAFVKETSYSSLMNDSTAQYTQMVSGFILDPCFRDEVRSIDTMKSIPHARAPSTTKTRKKSPHTPDANRNTTAPLNDARPANQELACKKEWVSNGHFQFDSIAQPRQYGLLAIQTTKEILDANEGRYLVRWHDPAGKGVDMRFNRSHGDGAETRVCIAHQGRYIEVVSYIDNATLQEKFDSNKDAICDLVDYLNRDLVLGAFRVDEKLRCVTYWCAIDCSDRLPTKEQLDNCIYEGYEQIHESYSLLWNTTLGYATKDAVRKLWEKDSPSRIEGERGGPPQLVSAVEEALRRSSLKFSKARLSRIPKRVVKSFGRDNTFPSMATFTILDWGVLVECQLPSKAGLGYAGLSRWCAEQNVQSRHGVFEVARNDTSTHYRAFLDVSGERPDFICIARFIDNVRTDIGRRALIPPTN